MKTELIELIRKLREVENQQTAYINKIPSDISSLIFDNEYSNLQGLKFDFVLQTLFGDLVEDIYWFLYEFKPGKTHGPHVITPDGVEHTFNSDEDYYEYLKNLTHQD